LILVLDIWLVILSIGEWLKDAGPNRVWLELLLLPVAIALLLLLMWIIFQPVLPILLSIDESATSYVKITHDGNDVHR